ncbi:MAG: hypothetical protein IT324_07015 [Anaerolineae bacterium]|nr:hypothetical protein [Anaerolineae bacterium]
MNKRGNEPKSLLRRLLRQADEQIAARDHASTQATKPSAGHHQPPPEVSPVRPARPEVVQPPDPLAPQPRNTQPINIPQQITDIEERLQAEEALEKLRQKTAQIASEFADGKLNRMQFTAMYAYYNERRVIAERLLARNPDTQAWQQVVQPGHTGFLRQYFEARVLSHAIYDITATDTTHALANQGTVQTPDAIVTQILAAIAILRQRNLLGHLSPARKQVDNGRWVVVIPGKYTVGITLFSLEPSTQQVTLVQDLHRDFERANRLALERGIRVPEQLVFPHRSLFEKADDLSRPG